MATKKKYYSSKRYHSSKRSSGLPSSLSKVIALVLVAAILVAGGIVFVPRLVHHCSNCDKLILGTGYYANVVTNTLAGFNGNGEKILCRDCAEKDHSLEILAGKTLDEFRRPLFESKGD